MTMVGLVLLAAFLIGAEASMATAQAPKRKIPNPVVDESFSIRLDENLFQLEETVALIAGSLSKVAGKTPTLAINSFHFGRNIDLDFRKKAEVIILDKVFQANPNVRLLQCQECQKLETKIEGNVLKLRKGIPNQESRRSLASKIGADGFIDIGIFEENKQLTVYLKVVEAKTGGIILVDELVGRRAPKRTAFSLSFGEMIFPISVDGTTVEYKALALSGSESIKLTGRFSFTVDLIFFKDNNENNPEATYVLDTGLFIVPTMSFDIIKMSSSTSRLTLFAGVGKLLSPQLSYANAFRFGTELIVGDRLTVLFAFNQFLEETVEPPTTTQTALLDGAGYEIRFGLRF